MSISILGKNIKYFREKKGWNLKKLIDVADVGYATIYDIENGKKQNINSTTLSKIAIALDVTPNDLLDINILSYSSFDISDITNTILNSNKLQLDKVQLTDKEKDVLKSIYKNGIDVIRVMRCS